MQITEDSSVESFHYRWRIMEQVWLYPEGKALPKEFNEPVPSEIKNLFKTAARDFHVPTVCFAQYFPIFFLLQHDIELIG